MANPPDTPESAGNFLVTGPPRSGKTTVLERTCDLLRATSADAVLPGDSTIGGFYTPEIRQDGKRVGFELRSLTREQSAVLAHVEFETGPQVGKYRVDVTALEQFVEANLPPARREADVVVIDEIAPMQLHSDRFVHETRSTLDAPVPVLGAIKYGVTEGFPGEVKSRADTRRFDLTDEDRDALPARLARQLRTWLQPE